jgi:hypothetical protein
MKDIEPDYRSVGYARTKEDKNWFMDGIRIKGQRYQDGVLAHSNSNLIYDLKKFENTYATYDLFAFCAGVDDANKDCGTGNVFTVKLDGVTKFKEYKGSREAATCKSFGMDKTRYINLKVNNNGGKCQKAAWASAKICRKDEQKSVNCVLSSWSKWGTCSRTCGTGWRTKTREIKRSPRFGGKNCGLLTMRQECSQKECPVDCRVTKWDYWSPCTKTCSESHEVKAKATGKADGPGFQVTHRSIARSPAFGGKACPPLKKSKRCNTQRCPVDCTVSKWSKWSTCDKKCGGGVEVAKRARIQKTLFGGRKCAALRKERPCNSKPCAINCALGDWSKWTTCSRKCGTGYKHQKRGVVTSADFGGKACGALTTTKACNTKACPINCKTSKWTAWSKCTKTCGGGKKDRQRSIEVHTAFGGKACGGLEQKVSCGAAPCPVDCAMNKWQSWSACSKSCGTGVSKRLRSKKSDPKFGGSNCPHRTESRKCHTEACPVNCVISQWGKYTACSKTCGTGRQIRYKVIASEARFGGVQCPVATSYINNMAIVKRASRSCKVMTCPVDCKMSAWSKFSTCTKSCGKGAQTRTRKVSTQAAHGGKKCPGGLSTTTTCNGQKCPVDCVVTKFSKFEACSATCGTGGQNRRRSITKHPQFGGKRCPQLVNNRKCNTERCPIDCLLNTWTAWAKCSKTCGGGTQNRVRSVKQINANGGKKCGPARENRHCNTRQCPIACKVTGWSPYGKCNAGCGGGEKFRARTVKVAAQHGGKACPSLWNSAKCNEKVCSVNCVLSSYSEFKPCTKSCGGGIRLRKRKVTQAAKYGGKKCSATSSSISCNTQRCPVDCKVSAFSSWSKCTKTCGMGFQYKLRKISVQPQHAGKKCPELRTVQFCAKQGCPIDCVMHEWGSWSGCTKTCGGGKQNSVRKVFKAAKFGGAACPKTHRNRKCNTRGCPVHCKLTQWSDWTECNASCGPGTSFRTRAVVAKANHGGKACGQLKTHKKCMISRCAVDCKVSKWGKYSPCTKTCGGGKTIRTRSVVSKSGYGGAICGSMREALSCRDQKCPIDCVLDVWSHFSACTKTCGGGRKLRTRKITVAAAYAGRVCDPLHEYQVCNAADCRIASNWGKVDGKTATPDFKDFDAKEWKSFNWAEFNKKSLEEQKKILASKKTAKAVPTNFPTAHPTFASKKMCTNGKESVKHGWAGAGYGANYCNLCKCVDGNLKCQTKVCGKVHRGKKCSHTTCKFEYSKTLKESVMVVNHHHSEHFGASHHCAYNLDSDQCQCNCFGGANKVWHAFNAKRDSVDALFGYEA